ncbi:MAG: hypothetical protein ABIJ09_16500 [Pseudomonadota bacterium]
MTSTPRIPASTQSLWRAAQQLESQGRLDGHELATLQGLKTGDLQDVSSEASLRALVHRHHDELDLTQHRDLATVLGLVPGAHEAPVIPLQAGSRTAGPAGGTTGPSGTMTERSVLEDLLQRHGPSLDGQLRNLVVGFLRTMPEEDHTPRRGQFGALAQIVALRSDHKPFPRRLDADPEHTPVSRQDLEHMLDANAARGQLLVAMGAASAEELARFNAGEMTLNEFYLLAARGHFGDAIDQPVRYEVLRERMTAAGLEIDFHRLLSDLDPAAAEKLLDGSTTPREIFSQLAHTRGRED